MTSKNNMCKERIVVRVLQPRFSFADFNVKMISLSIIMTALWSCLMWFFFPFKIDKNELLITTVYCDQCDWLTPGFGNWII